MDLKENKDAIEFCLEDSLFKEHCLKDYLGKWVVLYFYPKDNTAGCTKEAVEFSKNKDDFEKLGAVIIGISKDSPKSHAHFIEKQNLKIILLSDEEHKTLEAYGAWGKKKNYGKEYYGAIRSTFLIDHRGKIRKIWKNIKVNNHVHDVEKTLRALIEGTNRMTEDNDVLNVLKSSAEPLKTQQIAEKLNADKKEIDKIIKKLKKEGRIESPKRCYYVPKT